jgi:hypothetical protein
MIQQALLLLKLVVDLGIVHMMLVLQACRMQELWGHGAFTEISEESLRGQAICNRVKIPASSPQEGNV